MATRKPSSNPHTTFTRVLELPPGSDIVKLEDGSGGTKFLIRIEHEVRYLPVVRAEYHDAMAKSYGPREADILVDTIADHAHNEEMKLLISQGIRPATAREEDASLIK